MTSPRAVFGVFLDTLYGLEPAWAATSLLTLYGVYCLQDKHLVAAMAAATLEQVAARKVAVGDIVGLAEAAVERRVGRVVGKLEKGIADLELACEVS